MSLATFGTNATSTLSAMQWLNNGAQVADAAAFSAGIKDDVNVAHPRLPQGFTNNGMLFVPNRGVLKLLPGDWVAYSSTGFPILMSAAGKTADFTSVP